MNRLLLILILMVSALLRLVLAFQGGQYFLPDEAHFYQAGRLMLLVYDREFQAAGELLLTTPNPGYIVLALPGALIKHLLPYGLTGEHLAAAVMGLYSVAAIGLVYTIARKAGADERESLLAALLMATATSLFYFSRHFVPADAALGLCLLALWLSLEARARAWRLMVSGTLLAGACLVYSESGLLAVVVAVIIVFYRPANFSASMIGETLRRTLWTGAGAVLVCVGVLILVQFSGIGLEAYLQHSLTFSGPHPLESYQESPSVVWEYLWHSEHLLLLVWLIGIVLAAWRVRQIRLMTAGVYWLSASVLLYVLMVLSSTVLIKLVISGQAARQMVPCLVLAAAYGLAPLLDGRWRRCGFVFLVLIQAAANFYPPLMLHFPGDVLAPLAAQYDDYTVASTIVSAVETENPNPNPAARYWLINMANSWERPVEKRALPEGEVLFSLPHPLSYQPYQYEGYTAAERFLLDSARIEMLVVDTQPD